MMSHLEAALIWQIRCAKLAAPTPQYYFAKPRMWQFDLCWPDLMLAAEVEGGTWIQGRHSRGAGMRKDAEKYNEATLAGWRVLRFTSDMVQDGSALTCVERALKGGQ